MTTSTFTFLFTDIVESTRHAVRLGDARWDALLASYRASVRHELRDRGGFEVDAAGDGFFAVFPSAACAVACALSMTQQVSQLGLQCRTGLHSGECQSGGEKPSGVNVHVAARVMSSANPGEVLVSDSVTRMVPTLRAVAAGAHALSGLPGDWSLYRAA